MLRGDRRRQTTDDGSRMPDHPVILREGRYQGVALVQDNLKPEASGPVHFSGLRIPAPISIGAISGE